MRAACMIMVLTWHMSVLVKFVRVILHDVVVMVMLLLLLLLILTLMLIPTMLLQLSTLMLMTLIAGKSVDAVSTETARDVMQGRRRSRQINVQHMHCMRALREIRTDLYLHGGGRLRKHRSERVTVDHLPAVLHHPSSSTIQLHGDLLQRQGATFQTCFLLGCEPAATLAAAAAPCSGRRHRYPSQG
jgi:hypothetical protein